MKRILPLFLLAAALAAPTFASAANTPAYGLTGEHTFSVGEQTGSFTDVFKFSFVNATSMQANFDFGFSDVASASYSYRLAVDGAPTGSSSYTAMTIQYPTDFSTVAQTAVYAITPGTKYSLYVTGSSVGDGYSVTIDPVTFAASVPEPGEWALMLSGIALLAGVARRRNSNFAPA